MFCSWHFWRGARKALRPERLAVLWGRGARVIYFYGQPPGSPGRNRDPLERLHALFQELDICGRGDICRAAIQYLQSALDDVDPACPADLKPTMEAEVLADYAAVAAFQAAVEAGAPADVVSDMAAEAKAEIDRSVAKYIQERAR
ncbi:hypothetical protein G3N55_00210 [Dissulfurirhabdus thermomarina]|uniref:Uncharacterized protein n=1 Tax=Dissulfurirhabdus thermomarina TaxID=1765737 RepID=A0A6N9TMH1_DISTH|nr:hypothetical protein [Dissulfurirhabdus thermomarina]NDY41273.1 hypothetical protein [Dissulfurirhabdus thermomarina]